MFRYYASDIKKVLVSREGYDDLYERLALKCLLLGEGLDQIAQVPEVTPDGRFDKVRDACISVVSALDYFLDFFSQAFRKVYCMIFVLTF